MIGLLLAIIYLSFISLGLPDSLLGSAWPIMHVEFGVPVSYAGIVSMIIAGGTIVSSLFSDFLTKKLGAGLVTAVSVAITAVALFGFSVSTQFWMLIVLAIPYGLGAGGVDAALNNYVALHYTSKHMSWLHCMWGVGAAISPYVMGFALTKGTGWNQGYFIISMIQIGLSAIVFCSLPLWKKRESPTRETDKAKPLPFKSILKIRGAVPCFIAFFAYSALESTTMLWASSYMVDFNQISAETAASYASMFFIGITVGRALNGFLTIKFSDRTLIRAGQAIILIGLILIFIPSVAPLTFVGFVTVGLGCAPVYPCIIHMTPSVFGKDNSQAMIGVQMASAYIGTCFMPPLFGLIADGLSVKLLPVFLLFFFLLMLIMHELVVKKTKKNQPLCNAEHEQGECKKDD